MLPLAIKLIFFLLLILFHEQPQQLDESIRIPRETVEILRNQVFSFDTFFVTSQEPYEVSYLLNCFFLAHTRNCRVKHEPLI